MNQQYPFHCPAVAFRVVLYRQISVVSGIGSSAAIVQCDYDCSHANGCTHRYTEACRVYVLSR
ncbi:TPA: hypothetical protein ACK3PA_006121 [Burkholderia cenocepacia]